MNSSLPKLAGLVVLALGCHACAQAPMPADKPFDAVEVAAFAQPWAMTFLPDGRVLVTEKKGTLRLFTIGGKAVAIDGVPKVAYGGQGGLGDVALHPQFATNRQVYLSYAEPGADDKKGAAVARAKLAVDEDGGGRLEDLEVIWRQVPKVQGNGHYGHRILFGRDGKLWISSGERQMFDPAQDMKSNLGKILRLNDDGSVPADNPFVKDGGVTAQVWSLGHRNVLGMAFDAQDRLWEVEMGPRGGDELDLVVRGANYGYPIVSNGDHYNGRPIPDHSTRPDFVAPVITWTPVISPSSLIIYTGSRFPDWKGNGLIGGLSSESLVRVAFDGESAREVARYAMGRRIRGVAQDADGAIWVIEDGDGGRLLRLDPRGPGSAGP